MSSSARRGLWIVIGAGLAFFAFWWNGYQPPTAGGEAVSMAPWAHNYLPYRDYFFQAPPGVPILVQLISAIAGPHLIATLTFGALLRIGAACALYGLLLRIARPWHAALATLTALFVSSTDISDTPFYYNHLGASFVVIGTCLGAAGGSGKRIRHYVATVLAGTLLTYAVAIKQTMVFGSAAGVAALVLLVLPRPAGGWWRWMAGLLAGAVVAVGGIWLWLASHDLLGPMLETMREAPQGKGGVLRSMLRPVTLLPLVGDAFAATVAAWAVLVMLGALLVMHRRQRAIGHGPRLAMATIAAVCLGSLAGFRELREATLFLTALGWWGSLALAALHAGDALKTGKREFRATVALGLMSFGIGYCFAVSWPLFENFAFPALAIVVAVLLARPPAAVPTRWVAALTLAAYVAMGVAVYRKTTSPHLWGYWVEPPIFSPRGEFSHPLLDGIRISAPASDLYAEVEAIAQRTTGPSEPIYVFPNMPILYAIANRRPATYGLAHWVDICPDFLGAIDAARLRTNPPKLLIVRDDPLRHIEVEERVYRGGARSSVRDVLAAIDAILPRYDRVAVFKRAPTNQIAFYVRRDEALKGKVIE